MCVCVCVCVCVYKNSSSLPLFLSLTFTVVSSFSLILSSPYISSPLPLSFFCSLARFSPVPSNFPQDPVTKHLTTRSQPFNLLHVNHIAIVLFSFVVFTTPFFDRAGSATLSLFKPDGSATLSLLKPDGSATLSLLKPDGSATPSLLKPDGSATPSLLTLDGSATLSLLDIRKQVIIFSDISSIAVPGWFVGSWIKRRDLFLVFVSFR